MKNKVSMLVRATAVSAAFAVSATALSVEAQELDETTLLLGKGVQAESLGQILEAETYFRDALNLKEGTVAESDPGLIDLKLRLGMNLSGQGRHTEAELYFETVRQALLTGGNVSLQAKHLLMTAVDLKNRGDLEEAANRAATANKKLLDALKNQRSGSSLIQGVQVNQTELAFGLAVESSIALAQGRIAVARQYQELARRIVVETKGFPSWWLAQLDDLLAQIELKEKNFDSAETRLRTSLLIKRKAFGETRAVADSYLNLGALLAEIDKTVEAVTSMQSGLNIIQAGLKDGQSLGPDKVQTYLETAWALAQEEPDQRAELYESMFIASQLVRQGTTAQTVGRMVARLSAGGGSVAEQVRASQEANRLRDNARIALGTEAAKRASERDGQKLKDLRDTYLALQAVAKDEADKLRAVFPQYEQIVESKAVPVADIQALLGPGEAYATFLNGKDNGFTFIVTPGQLLVTPTDLGEEEVAESVTVLKEAFDVTDGSLGEYNTEESWQLYSRLFGALGGELDTVTHLIVSPTGPLLSLPFAILAREKPIGEPGKEQYLSTRWLGRDMATSISPSLAAFVGLRSLVRPSAASRLLVGFGDPVFEGEHAGMSGLEDECPANGVMPSSLVRGLAPLPNTKDELQIVSELVGKSNADLTFGDAVREPAIRDMSLKDYRIVYFATHGLLPQELECQSEPALALTAPLETTSTLNDGLLGASEIAELELDADLVVLSACNTGGGDGQFGGDSLSGLAKAFFYSGARSLVVSHWQVSSRDTVSLMTGLFGKASQGLSEAMRQAQVDMMQKPETAHPFFWGPFTLVGDGARSMVF